MGRVIPVPTVKQYDTLRTLGSGSAGIAWLKSRIAPLLRRGWVTDSDDNSADRYTGFVRITPDGLRALAAAVERYGLPPLTDPKIAVRVCAGCGADFRPVCKFCGENRYRFESRDAREAA